MKKNRIDINLGCGHTILSFFLGLIALVIVLAAIVFTFFALLFT